MSDGRGVPLVIAVGPANQRDEELVEPMLKRFPPLRGRDGKRRKKPKVLQGDRGYGFPHIIKLLLRLVIGSLLAMRGSPHGSGLGKTRYVIERTMAWLGEYRRLKVCYERSGERFRGFHVLAACVICSNRLQQTRRRRL
jgi:Transposase DDE domain